MSRRISLFISDIDGTLVRRDKTLADATVAALKRLRAAGVPLTLISARPPSGIYRLAERLEIEHPLGAFNGGTLFHRDGRVITSNAIPADVAEAALERFARAGVTRWVFADGIWFATDVHGDHGGRERIAAGVEPVLTDSFRDVLPRIDKIVAVSDDELALAALERESQAAWPNATVARSQPYYLDITSKVANKGDGVAALAEAIGVSLADVAVAGDMMNDLPMFARAGLSVAMGQGPAEVQSAATLRTLPTDEDGLAHAIDTLILPLLER